MARSVINKAAFFQDLGYEPHDGQWKIHESTASRRIVACGSRWGKTVCAAMEGLAAAMEPRNRSMGWVVAPNYELADKVFREITILAATHLRERIVTLKQHDKKIVLTNLGGGRSEIRAKTADNPISLLGEGLDWVICDEASRLKPLIWDSYISQRLMDKAGWALLISTPKGKGWFYELFQRGVRGDEDHESWNSPSWENPHLNRKLIEKERERLPDRVFRQELGGEFIEGAGSVFRNVRDRALVDFMPPAKESLYWAGLDLARVHDYTVLVIMNSVGDVVHMDRFTRLDWSVQVNRIKATCDRYNRPVVRVDSTGAGEPVYERLLEEGINAEEYTFTAASKAALVNNLSLMFEQSEIRIPKANVCPEMIDELEAFQYSVTDKGNVRMEAPSGQHDDIVMALALAAFDLKTEGNRGITCGVLRW